MKCERLIKLIKNWYIQVQDEAMAPARMVDFMRSHLADCPVCKSDLGVDLEVKKIIEIILPPTKVPKAVRKEDEPGGAADFEEYEGAADDAKGVDDAEGDEDDDAGEGADDLEDEEIDDPEEDDI